MTYKPKYSFFKSIVFYLRIVLANWVTKKKDKFTGKPAPVYKRRNTITIIDSDDTYGVRQFLSYNGITRRYYAEAVWGMQIRNNEFSWPHSRRNVWKAIDECDKMSVDILRVVSPDVLNKK